MKSNRKLNGYNLVYKPGYGILHNWVSSGAPGLKESGEHGVNSVKSKVFGTKNTNYYDNTELRQEYILVKCRDYWRSKVFLITS